MCLRLDATDISTAALTSRDVFSLVDNYSLASENVIVLLDTQCVFGYAAPQIAAQATRLLSSLSARKWSAILVGGYGIPEQISTAVSTKAQGYIRALSKIRFLSWQKGTSALRCGFADYTTLSPSVIELDWQLINKVMTPRAIYTLGIRGSLYGAARFLPTRTAMVSTTTLQQRLWP